MNTTPLPKDIIEKYKAQNEFPVIDDLDRGKGFNVMRGNFLAAEEVHKPSGDVLKRSLIRHDSDKLAKVIISLL